MACPANVVIGGNYGDEGKGLFTNFFAEIGKNESNPHLTVRFNGGAQAGHTVINKKNNKRHVFNHIGSGTFHGAETLLDEMFVANPFIFRLEYERFISEHSGIKYPKVFIHYDCLITTPYEILINQLKEEKRTKTRMNHGSCGVGFGETAKKNFTHQDAPKLKIADCFYKSIINNKLKEIRDYTLDVELKDFEPDYLEYFLKEEKIILEKFASDLSFMLSNCTRINAHGAMSLVKSKYETSSICFEGAQGLGLDMDYGFFPHVTFSHTGIHNLVKYISEGVDLNINYITRSYLTRHGSGPMENEGVLFLPMVKDLTNVQNKYQGFLRIAPLCIDTFKNRVRRDLDLLSNMVGKPKYNLCMTHCHHTLSNDYSYIKNGTIINGAHTFSEFKYLSYNEFTNPL